MPRHLPEHSQPGAVDVLGDPDVLAPHPLAMVYGGGGIYGIAFGLGVAHGLADSGIAVTTAPSLGTSAGAWVASGIALGVPYDDFATAVAPRVPARRFGVLAQAARAIFGEATHHLVAVSAVALRSRRRHILDGDRYPLADLAAASSAVPGLFPPHAVDGRLYIDGGMWSVTSVDAAADAHDVIVIAPLAGHVLGPIGRGAGLLLGRELRTWQRRHPEARITMIRPNRELARIAGSNPFHLFEQQRAHAAYPLALSLGRQWGERLQAPRLDP